MISTFVSIFTLIISLPIIVGYFGVIFFSLISILFGIIYGVYFIINLICIDKKSNKIDNYKSNDYIDRLRTYYDFKQHQS